jgi:hypothetical protein
MGILVFASYSAIRNVFHSRFPKYHFISPRFPADLLAKFQICWFLSTSSLCRNFRQAFPVGKVARAWRWPPTPVYRRGWRKSRAIPVLLYPLWTFMACSGLNVWAYIGVLHLFSLKPLRFTSTPGVHHVSVAHLLVPTIVFILPKFPAGLTAVFSTCLSSRTASLCLLLQQVCMFLFCP